MDTGPRAGHPNAKSESRSEEHTSELQSHVNLVCRLLLEKKKLPRRGTVSRVISTSTGDVSPLGAIRAPSLLRQAYGALLFLGSGALFARSLFPRRPCFIR